MNEIPQVLIIDDEKSARKTMEMLLAREGYALYFAEDGYEALVELEEMEPDVILMDVMMPGMDGFTLCQKLKSKPRYQHIPIILVTALDQKEDLARGLEVGADDFINKPVNGLELRARVRSMLRIKQRHDELQVTLQLREDLSNMIVHDIRSPLATIQVFADLLQGRVADKEGAAAVSSIQQEAKRLSSFLTDMLMVAKMEHGRFVLNKSAVNIRDLVQNVFQTHQPLAESRKIDLVLEMPEYGWETVLDASLWHRLLDNLLSNALKFTPAGRRVLLSVAYPTNGEQFLANGRAEAPPTRLRIQVVDEGPGIPVEHREKIFNKYEIVSASGRDVRQVGLGLAFCKMVVDAHNGRVLVTDNAPQGSRFIVEL